MSIPASDHNTVTIVMQIFPPQHASVTPALMSPKPPALGGLEKFLEGEPKALGTVQIMVGVVVLLLGITVQVLMRHNFSVYIIFVVVGTLIYIATGIVTVVGGNKLDKNVVKASLGMNVLSTITAAACCPALFTHLYRPYNENYNRDWTSGIASVQLILSVLQFIISVYISALGCKATCYKPPPEIPIHINTFVPNTSGRPEEVYQGLYQDVDVFNPSAEATQDK